MKRILPVILCLCILFTACSVNTGKTKEAELYFVNADKTQLVTEKRAIPTDGDGFMKNVVNALLAGPLQPGSQRIIPEDTKLLSIKLEGKIAYANMSKSFDSGNDIDKLLRRYTLISTLCSIEGVQKTKILVEGKDIKSISNNGRPLEALGKEDIVMANSQQSNNSYTVSLYFADDKAQLKTEKRVVRVTEGTSREKAVVEEIIKGPAADGLYPTVGEKTKVLDVSTKEKVCFVNLSANFLIDNTGSSTQEYLAVYSIVNSLCELDSVDKVQFLIEGESKEYFGQMVFNEAFTAMK
ncbi:MAG: GerMN domain-containing protein [Clostridia bacterium]|nr:GerMN domain-containing protein [Clostridia bacterium]